MPEYRPRADYEAAARDISRVPAVVRVDPHDDHCRIVLLEDVHRVPPDVLRHCVDHDLGVAATGYDDAGRKTARVR